MHAETRKMMEERDALLKQNAGLKKKLKEANGDASCFNQMWPLLLPYAGETGANEGAVDTLKRKLSEFEALKTENSKPKTET